MNSFIAVVVVVVVVVVFSSPLFSFIIADSFVLTSSCMSDSAIGESFVILSFAAKRASEILI